MKTKVKKNISEVAVCFGILLVLNLGSFILNFNFIDLLYYVFILYICFMYIKIHFLK